MPCRVARLFCATLLLTFATAAAAEDVSSEPPAHVSYVDGGAVLERDGQPDTSLENMPILAGDRIRTEGGRVEVLFADHSILHLDANTTVDFQSDELVRLLSGRIRLSIPGPDRQVNYRVDAPSASVNIDAPGEYRVSMVRGNRDAEVELMVLRGAAELVNDQGRTPLRAGQRAAARVDAAPSYAYAFNSASWDAFDRWSEARRDQRLGVSTQYLPEEVRPYAASLDGAGDWRYDASYGYVWYPTVAAGWRPYLNGRWVGLRPYGWTWVGVEAWGWPTHHYGRWGVSAGAWFWIPGRSWAPAWVSWAYAPGYVSWCPLGWNNRAVVQIVSVPGHPYYPWHAWTAVAYGQFGHGYVHVAPHTVYAGTVHGFVAAQAAPAIRGYAVPRSSAPIRVAGTGAVPRGGSPVYTNLEPAGSRVVAGGSRTMVGPTRSASLRPVPGQTVDSASHPRAVPRESVGPPTSNAYRSRPGDINAPDTSGTVGAPSPARSNGAGRDVASGAPTAVRRADGRAGQPAGIRADDGRTAAGSVIRNQPIDGARSNTVPSAYPQYGAQPRAIPRDNPAYRPMPASPGVNNIVRTPAPFPPAGEMRAPDRPTAYSRPGPEMRTPERAPEGARAVPRAEPGNGRSAAAAPPSGGAQHAAPAAQPAGGAPSGGGHSNAGGRGR